MVSDRPNSNPIPIGHEQKRTEQLTMKIVDTDISLPVASFVVSSHLSSDCLSQQILKRLMNSLVSRFASCGRQWSRQSPSLLARLSRTPLTLFASPFCNTGDTLLSFQSKSRHRPFSSASSSSSSSSSFSNLLSGNPFVVLGVSNNSSFAVVRRAFVQLALEHHPDRASGSTENFLRIRQAFEDIQHAQGGNDDDDDASVESRGRSSSSRRSSTPSGWTPDELRQWYQDETGEFLAFSMSECTRQEVIQEYKRMSVGGKAPKGGYWELARQLTERETLRGGADDEDGPMKLLSDSKPSVGRRKRQRR
jgi:hypothetical protein